MCVYIRVYIRDSHVYIRDSHVYIRDSHMSLQCVYILEYILETLMGVCRALTALMGICRA